MYYVEARFSDSGFIWRCDLLQTAADVISWTDRFTNPNVIFCVVPPSFATKEDLERISELGAVILTVEPFEPVDQVVRSKHQD